MDEHGWVLTAAFALDVLGEVLNWLAWLDRYDEVTTMTPSDSLPLPLRIAKEQSRAEIERRAQDEQSRADKALADAWAALAAAAREDLGADLALLVRWDRPDDFRAEADEWLFEFRPAGHHPIKARFLRKRGGWERVPFLDTQLEDPLADEADRPWWLVCSPAGARSLATIGTALHFAERTQEEFAAERRALEQAADEIPF